MGRELSSSLAGADNLVAWRVLESVLGMRGEDPRQYDCEIEGDTMRVVRKPTHKGIVERHSYAAVRVNLDVARAMREVMAGNDMAAVEMLADAARYACIRLEAKTARGRILRSHPSGCTY